MFQNVDTTKGYSIQDIVPTSGIAGQGNDQIQILDAVGNLSEAYTYFYDDVWGKAGWYLNETKYADRTLKNGESFLLYNDNPNGCSIQFAGQVCYSSSTIESANGGFVVVGNATPVEVDIQQFKPTGFVSDGGEQIQILDETGCVGKTFVYFEAGVVGPKTGWYEEDGSKLAEYVFKAGQGFMVYAPRAFTITIPGVAR